MLTNIASTSMAHRRFLLGTSGTVIVAVTLVAILNWWVDPYRLFSMTPSSRLVATKVRPESNIANVKLLNALAMRPDVLILGNSRADVGFDPQHPALLSLGNRAYNLAVPGQGIMGVLSNLRTLLEESRIRAVVVGVDFTDFVIDSQPVSALFAQRPADTSRVLLAERARALFTLAGTIDTWRTLMASKEKYPATLRADGFNPMRDYLQIAATSGYREMFAQRFEETARIYQHARLGILPPMQQDSAEFAALREILRLASARNVRVFVVTYPYHVDYLMLYRKLGLWNDFQRWKRRLAEAVSESAREHPDSIPPQFWDFATFSKYSTLPVPKPARDGAAAWYWEAGHFKKELGDVILMRMLSPASADGVAAGFGRQLTPDNIDVWLEEQDRLAEAHIAAMQSTDGSDYFCCNEILQSGTSRQ